MKSRWSTRFLRIENLWPRDDSCSHTFTLFALFFLKSPSLLKPRRMNSQNIISGILAQFRSLPNNPVVRSWILKSNECPLLLLKCLINPKQRYARLKSSSAVDNAPPSSSYPNPVPYEKGSGMFLFAESFAKGLLRTADEQRQGITVAVVSCLLIFLTEYGILGLTDGNRQRS